MEEGMSASELNRLIEWLKSKGMTAEEIVACLDYITKK